MGFRIHTEKEGTKMILSAKFIKANDLVCDFGNPVPAPCFRKAFTLSSAPHSAEITICGLGFYDLSINGTDIS